jgi:hypothetical protein
VKTESVFLDFINTINARKPAKLLAFLSDEHQFQDPSGNILSQTSLLQKWTDRFIECPDYRIVLHSLLRQDAGLGAFGYSYGTYKQSHGLIRRAVAFYALLQAEKISKLNMYETCLLTKVPIMTTTVRGLC